MKCTNDREESDEQMMLPLICPGCDLKIDVCACNWEIEDFTTNKKLEDTPPQ